MTQSVLVLAHAGARAQALAARRLLADRDRAR